MLQHKLSTDKYISYERQKILNLIIQNIDIYLNILFCQVYSSLDLDWKKNEVNKYTVLFVLLGVLAAVSMCTKVLPTIYYLGIYIFISKYLILSGLLVF